MNQYDLVIKDARLVDPERSDIFCSSIGIKDGFIAEIGEDIPEGERNISAEGCFVCPGFIDTHMHDEDPYDPDTTQKALLRQGVTTGIAGNCGSGPLLEKIAPSRSTPWINIGYLTGHRALREEVGIPEEQRYRPAREDEISRMRALLLSELKKGSFGLSLGLEYAPNTSWEEIVALSELVPSFPCRWVSSHIRYDGPRCIEGVEEMVSLSEVTGARVQLSHLGSMTAFGRSAEALDILHKAVSRGIDLTWDSYPYAAFCTFLGSAVFDPGFEERFKKPIHALEIGSGSNAGKRMDGELFEKLRKEEPETLIIAHVMNEEEMRLVQKDPRCAIASDAILLKGGGHPRAAGAFPRGILWLREEGLSWNEAISHATSIPAGMTWLERGYLKPGTPADLVVFDPLTFMDRATFEKPLLPPEGIGYVIVNGQVAVEEGKVNEKPAGQFLTRI